MVDEELENLVLSLEMSEPERVEVLEIVRAPAPIVAPEKEDIRTQIANAGLPEKMKLAMFGSAIARGLLIRDANKLIQQSVLKNPKLTGQEVEAFANNPNISEQVLRLIADSRVHMKSSAVKLAMVQNPKTPIDIALKWIRYLQKPEIKEISKSRNVSQVVSTAAKRLLPYDS